jgi:hypothetical protein
LPGIVVLPPQVTQAGKQAALPLARKPACPPEACKNAKSVLQYRSQSDSGRSTVRYATRIEQIPGSPFVAWHVENVAASFLRLETHI